MGKELGLIERLVLAGVTGRDLLYTLELCSQFDSEFIKKKKILCKQSKISKKLNLCANSKSFPVISKRSPWILIFK